MSIRYRDAYTGRCVQRAWARILAAMWLGALTQGCGGLAKEVENGGVAVLQEELECAQRRLLEARHRFEEQGSKRTMWRGEFPTVEAAHMLGEYLPVVLDVGDDDTPDIYFYLAYSSVWSKFPEKRMDRRRDGAARKPCKARLCIERRTPPWSLAAWATPSPHGASHAAIRFASSGGNSA